MLFSDYCTSSFISFLFPKCFTKSVSCDVNVHQMKHSEHIGPSHASKWNSHILGEWFGQEKVDLRFLNGTTLCSRDSSEGCSPSHALHRFMWQTSLFILGPGSSLEYMTNNRSIKKQTHTRVLNYVHKK